LKITLIRHGEVEEKYQGCYNGHIDVALSKKGHSQAKELAQKFKDEKYDAVFCSDLKRARQTLSYFPHAKDAIYTDKLREKSWGKHEGLSFDEIIAQNEIKYENFLQWIEALDGEDYQSYINRIKDFFNTIQQQNKQNILIITHSGVIKTLIFIKEKITIQESFSTKLPYASYMIYENFKI